MRHPVQIPIRINQEQFYVRIILCHLYTYIVLWIEAFIYLLWYQHTTLLLTEDEIEQPETKPNAISEHEGFVNISGWLCFKSPMLSKLGKRKHNISLDEEPEFMASQWVDLQSLGNYSTLFVQNNKRFDFCPI